MRQSEESHRRTITRGKSRTARSRSSAVIAGHLSVRPCQEGAIAITARSVCTRGMSIAAVPAIALAIAVP